MSRQSQPSGPFRASAMIAYSDILPSAGRVLDPELMAAQARFVWDVLSPEMTLGTRSWWFYVSSRAVRTVVVSQDQTVMRTETPGDPDRMWVAFRADVATALVHMMELNTDITPGRLRRIRRDLLGRLESPDAVPFDPLEDAEEEEAT